jgi:hypothetical protein
MLAARSCTVSSVSGSHGEQKKKQQKAALWSWEEDCPGNKGSLHFLFLAHRSIQTCHFVHVVLDRLLLATTLVVWILQA